MADITGQLQAAAGNSAGAAEGAYIEDVFSTYLYTGNGSTQTITNGIDLDGEGGLVWLKCRSNATDHAICGPDLGVDKYLSSNDTIFTSSFSAGTGVTSFNSDGFSIGSATNINLSSRTYASWTFRKAPKFFDVVAYTGTGSARTVSHNLGSVPGCIIIKRLNGFSDWQVYHRANTANPETDYLVLNSTAATVDSNTRWNDTLPTDSVFTVGTEATVNASGGTYVAYLFAHDAGGFGDDGEQNVISCGSYVPDGSGAVVNLGWEPQWILIKPASFGSAAYHGWGIFDNMRGVVTGGNDNPLAAHLSDAEGGGNYFPYPYLDFTSTGFTVNPGSGQTGQSGETYIYIAIRRGPMKTPTSGTEVFSPNTYTGNVTRTQKTSGFPVDFLISSRISPTGNFRLAWNRLTSDSVSLRMNDVDPESTGNDYFDWDTNDGIFLTTNVNLNNTSNQYVLEMFQRAPGFMDVVCYTGTGSAKTEAHNLGVVPELMFVKNRSDATGRAWAVYAGDNTDYLVLNTTAATADDNTYWNDTSPTASVFTVGTNNSTNESGDTFVAYLFASLAGVSKIGTYTGNGTSVTVTTGFQPRFILVKRTDSTGNWLLGDSARGLVAGDDPFLVVNTADAQVTNQDWVDVSATGFTINETAANANVDTGTYLYLAIS